MLIGIDSETVKNREARLRITEICVDFKPCHLGWGVGTGVQINKEKVIKAEP